MLVCIFQISYFPIVITIFTQKMPLVYRILLLIIVALRAGLFPSRLTNLRLGLLLICLCFDIDTMACRAAAVLKNNAGMLRST